METTHFSPDAPGQLVPILGKASAFVPEALPPNWEFPKDLWPLLAEAKQLLGLLEGIGQTLPNPHILLRPLADREAIRSSRLEGTYVTARELLLFQLEPRESGAENSPINDRLEVLNYRKALQHGIASDLPLSLRLIKELHKILLTGVRGRERTPGEFRRIQVAIGAASRFVPPPAEMVAAALRELEHYIHHRSDKFDPLVDCYLVHYQFEAIHPFIDGNGRVGRLLLALMTQKFCDLSKPWLYMSEYFERNRDDYIDHLYRISTNGNWHAWIEFCLKGTVTQAQDAVNRCKRLQAIRGDYITRTSNCGGSVRLTHIVEGLFDSPFVSVTELRDRMDVSYPTAKSDLERLVSIGIMEELAGYTPKTYFAPEVFGVAYEKLEDE